MSKELYRNKNTGKISEYQGYRECRGKLFLYFYDNPENIPIPDSKGLARYNPNGWTSSNWNEVEKL